RSFAADLEFILKQILNAVIGHKQHNDIGRRAADLKADTAAAKLEQRRRTPTAARAARDQALASLTTDDKRALKHIWKNRHSLCLSKQIDRDGSIADRHDLVKGSRRFLRRNGGTRDLFLVGFLAYAKGRCEKYR